MMHSPLRYLFVAFALLCCALTACDSFNFDFESQEYACAKIGHCAEEFACLDKVKGCTSERICLDDYCNEWISCYKVCQPTITKLKTRSSLPPDLPLAELTQDDFQALCVAHDATIVYQLDKEMRCNLHAETKTAEDCDFSRRVCSTDEKRLPDPPSICDILRAEDFAGCTADANLELFNSCLQEFANAAIEFYENFSCEGAASGSWLNSYSFQPSQKCQDELFLPCVTGSGRGNPFIDPPLP